MAIPNILTIAGSDPSGGAGIQADLKTIAANGGYGLAAITAVTVQNSRGVQAVHPLDAAILRDQMSALFEDIRIDAIKIGMLANKKLVRTVADSLRGLAPVPVVLDPVCIATDGHHLLEKAALDTLIGELLPQTSVLTPNLAEAAALLGSSEPRSASDMREAADALLDMGPRAILLKGGHLGGASSPDLLTAGDTRLWLEADRIATKNTHGTGCTLSSAIACLIPQRDSIIEAASEAKHYVHGAIIHGSALRVGRGHGPIHHGWQGCAGQSVGVRST